MTARAADKFTSPDFVPRADRHRGLTISTYRVSADGARHDRTRVVDVDVDPGDPDAYHPGQGRPLCACPRCRTDASGPRPTGVG